MNVRSVLCGAVVGGVLLLSQPAQARNVPDVDGRGTMYGKDAPAFEVKGPYGETYTRERLAGNVIVLQFGTSW